MPSIAPDTGVVVFQPWVFEPDASLSYAASDAKLMFFILYFSRILVAPFSADWLRTSTELGSVDEVDSQIT